MILSIKIIIRMTRLSLGSWSGLATIYESRLKVRSGVREREMIFLFLVPYKE